jgi:hypothetical protein
MKGAFMSTPVTPNKSSRFVVAKSSVLQELAELERLLELFPDATKEIRSRLNVRTQALVSHIERCSTSPTGRRTTIVKYELPKWLKDILITLRARDRNSDKVNGGSAGRKCRTAAALPNEPVRTGRKIGHNALPR